MFAVTVFVITFITTLPKGRKLSLLKATAGHSNTGLQAPAHLVSKTMFFSLAPSKKLLVQSQYYIDKRGI